MYAIFEDGGRQFKVDEGQEIEVDYREVSSGAELRFDSVLAYRDEDGLTADPRIRRSHGRGAHGQQGAETGGPKIPPA